jgi:predicted nucleic acid-binding protein
LTTFFLDASALAKRYLTEQGSRWILGITSLSANHSIIIAEITRIEVAAALAARHRAPNGISRRQRDGAVSLLLYHCDVQYRAVALNKFAVSRAVDLTQNYRLRGYDAVQLSIALVTNVALVAAGLNALTFVTADTDLISAAQEEGLIADNPNLYP